MNPQIAVALQLASNKAENKGLRSITRFAAMAFVLVSACLTGLPSEGIAAPQAAGPHATVPPDERIDINHASVNALLKLPGMTRTWAERIMRFRPYHAKNDLLDRGVVTSQVYDRIKDYVIAHRDKE